MGRTLFLCLIFASAITCSGQKPNITDSLRAAFNQMPSFTANFNTRNTIVTGRPIRTRSVKAGMAYGKRVGIGVGFHWLEHNNVKRYDLIDGVEEQRELRMAYGTVYFEYSFVRKKNWEITLPVQLGLGISRELMLSDDASLEINRGGFLLYEPSMIAQYNFFRYFGIGGGVGLRIMLVNNGEIDEQFTAPLYQLHLKIRFGDIWNDIITER
ncbi:MAG: hypothetical protein ACI923_001958 [Flavobacteriales bacterium]|jgi:hypothetical protein